MPNAAPRPCTKQGCGALVHDGSGRCAAHPKPWVKPDAVAEPARLRGRAGVARRARWLMEHPLCEYCRRETPQRITVGVEVDHVVPLAEGGADEESNLQTLCLWHHRVKSSIERGRALHSSTGGDVPADNFPSWLPPARCKLTVVFGPPASGKSTLVRERMQPEDVVIDLDLIVAELSGQPIYQASHSWLNVAIRERNARLADLSRCDPTLGAWFLTGGAGKMRRAWWTETLRPAAVVLLEVKPQECVRRIYADDRRSKVRVRHTDAVQEWWTDHLAP